MNREILFDETIGQSEVDESDGFMQPTKLTYKLQYIYMHMLSMGGMGGKDTIF